MQKAFNVFWIGKYSDKEGRAEEWFARGKMVKTFRFKRNLIFSKKLNVASI